MRNINIELDLPAEYSKTRTTKNFCICEEAILDIEKARNDDFLRTTV